MSKNNHTQPEFLLAEIPIKDGSFNDNRIWIYHRPSLSLIEFICVSDLKDFEFEGKQDYFLYKDEEWFGVFVQNNCEATGKKENDVLKSAWQYLKTYLDWEIKNIKNDEKANLN